VKIMKARHIPNILSASRIPCALTLPFLGLLENKLWFLAVFAYIGISDVFDGIIARKFNWQSELGEKLDSIGDGMYILLAIIAAIVSIEQITLAVYHYAIFAVLMLGRIVNQVVTWKKFRRVGFIHTRSTRWASIPIFILMPIAILLGQVPAIPLAIFLSLTAIAQVEETFILRAMQPGEYTMSIKSYWEWKRDRALSIATEPAEKQEVAV